MTMPTRTWTDREVPMTPEIQRAVQVATEELAEALVAFDTNPTEHNRAVLAQRARSGGRFVNTPPDLRKLVLRARALTTEDPEEAAAWWQMLTEALAPLPEPDPEAQADAWAWERTHPNGH